MRLHVQLQGGERVVSLTDFEEAVRQGLILAETPMRMSPEEAWRCAKDFPIFHATMDSPELRLRRAWQTRRVPWMTALIVGLCIRMHLWFWGTATGEQVWDRGTRWWPAVAEKGESWRLLSYGFLHANFAHITMNLLFVAYAGVALENMFGSGGLLLLFVAGVWGGGLFSSMMDPTTKAVGASAGDFALLGASVLFGWRHADIIPARAKPAFGAVILLFTLQALFGSFGEEGVDWQAHLGGAIVGGIFGSLLVPTALAHAERRNRWVHGIFWSLVITSLVGLWAAAPSGLRWTPAADGGVETVRPLWWEVGWSPSSSSSWVSPTGEGSLVIETTEQEKYWSLAEEESSLRARLQDMDPQ
ncbi:MAG TPA: rhomboid family intramembrane serine protease, partial [Myxococcota bacterium]|nr:rhomboid family intramembrane serine protease [Myxococcota bacterium]